MSIEQHTGTPQSTHVGSFDSTDHQLIRYLGLNPDSPADRAMVAVCRHYGFDPILKHVVVIPKGGVYVTRDGLLHVAHSSGQLDGIVVEDGPRLVDNEWVTKVSVYRKDMSHPFTFVGRYSVNGGNKQYAPEMSLKAAESHALRRAFSITGIPALDEQRAEEKPQRRGLGDVMADKEAAEPEAEETTEPLFDVTQGELVEDPGGAA